jgi:hypothetical protein
LSAYSNLTWRPQPLIGATEGGEERGGVKSDHPFERQLANAHGERRDQGRGRSSNDLLPDVGRHIRSGGTWALHWSN